MQLTTPLLEREHLLDCLVPDVAVAVAVAADAEGTEAAGAEQRNSPVCWQTNCRFPSLLLPLARPPEQLAPHCRLDRHSVDHWGCSYFGMIRQIVLGISVAAGASTVEV